MDAFKGRSQTTKGIWIARAVGIAPCTVIMDVEGSDGKERGKKDETAFEKQSALFALAVSDVVLINMWCHDIGREQAANRPLLKTVFQVMMQLFSPRKTTLLFVIRDKTKTPLEYLEASLREDIQQIWDTVQKPQAFKDTPVSDLFNVQVTALPSYEREEDQFKEQVGELRQQFFNSIAPGGLAGDRRGVVPALGFSNWAEKIWKDIKENRDLDLPAHRVMMASIRCDEIGSVLLRRFTSDESWLSLEKAVQAGPEPGFVQRLSTILETYLSEYDAMTLYYDENVRKTKQLELEAKALQLVHPAYVIFLQHVRSATLESFKVGLEQALHKGEGFASSVRKCTQDSMSEFDFSCAGSSVQQANWDTSKVREKLHRDIKTHASAVCKAKFAEIVTRYEKLLDEALIAPVESLFDTIDEHTWASVRKLLKQEIDAAVVGFSSAISGFELDHSTTLDNMVKKLEINARSVVEKKSKEEAKNVLIRMKERFSSVFNVQRVWTEKEDIPAIIEAARSASLKLLAAVAAIRLDEKLDKVEDILFSSLMHATETGDLLASCLWEEVPPETTLITPMRCKSLWTRFEAETKNEVAQALSEQVKFASTRCDEIGSEQLRLFTSDERWLSMENAVQAGPVPCFGKILSSILENYLSEYDTLTLYYDEKVKKTKRQDLVSNALQLVHPAYVTLLGHLHSATLESFKMGLEQALRKEEGFASSVRKYTQASMLEFDSSCAGSSVQQANWDTSKVREKLHRDIKTHASAVCKAKFAEIVTRYEKLLDEALIAPVESLFDTIDEHTWASVRKLLKQEIDAAVVGFSSAISGFELDHSTTLDNMVKKLEINARSVVEKKSKEEAKNVLIRMKERFSSVFNVQRVWTEKEDIPAIIEAARSASLKLLAAVAAIRLDEKLDKVEDILFSSLMHATETGDLLASCLWEEVPPETTLITPMRCKSLWTRFEAETKNEVAQALSEQVKFASTRCDEIGSEQLRLFTSDERWLSMENAVQAGPVPCFGKILSSILENYLSEYDTLTLYYDEKVKKTKRQDLVSNALQLVHPAYVTLLGHLHSATLESFKMGLEQALRKEEGFASSVRKYTQASMLEFDSSCAGASVQLANWDASKVQEKLSRQIVKHASAVRSAKLAEIVTSCEKRLDEALITHVESLFETIGEDTWASIRDLLKRQTDAVVARFSSATFGFELDHPTLNSMVQSLRNYAKSVVEKKSKEVVWRVPNRMKDRFSTVFDLKRVWTEKEDIPAIRNAAWSASLKLLAVVAVIRLDEKPDKVEDILFASLMHGTTTTDLLASNSWEKVPPETTLITPIGCKSLWTKFIAGTEDAVTLAASAQKAYIKKKSKSHLGSKVLSHFVGATTGLVTGSVVGLVGGVGGLIGGGPVGPVLGLAGVAGGVPAGVGAGVAVTDALLKALGVPADADNEVILKRNQDMLAESD